MYRQPAARLQHTLAQSLTHVLASGEANMVDVLLKQITKRHATAVGTLTFSHKLPLELVRSNGFKKGDVLATARIAGIMAAKRTSELIPLCHPIPLSKVLVEIEESGDQLLEVRCHAVCTGQTGVEMEALTGALGALLTVYDMCKAVDRHMVIGGVQVVEKAGGKHDFKV